MHTLTSAAIGKFDPERLFRPSTISISGSGALAARLKTALAQAEFTGRVLEADETGEADLAFITDEPAQVPARLRALAGRLRGGAVVLSACADLRPAAIAAGARVIGPCSFGLATPGIGLNGLLAHHPPAAGRVAFIGQSASFARTIIDWAATSGVGFSHVVGIGGNADIGFGRVLDYLSRDAGTGAILIEIDRLRDPRLFFSAAKAAARLRPIVAIVPGARLINIVPGARPGNPDDFAIAGFEAACARAGILLTRTLGDFLSAAETLTRARPARGEALAVIGNTNAGCHLAADAALASGLALADLTSETRQIVGMMAGRVPDPMQPIVLPGLPPTRIADVAALLGAAPEVGGVLVVHAPGGGKAGADQAAMAALDACARTSQTPLLAAVLGGAVGGENRLLLAAGGVAVFETPEAAVSGFRDLVRNRRSRLAARELPPSAVLEVAPDRETVKRIIAKARGEGRDVLAQQEAFAVLEAYGIGVFEARAARTPEDVAACAEAIGFPVVVKLSHPNFAVSRPVGSVALDLPDAASARAAALAIEARLRSRGALPPDGAFLVQKQAMRARELRIRMVALPVLGPVIGFGPGGGDLADVSGLAVDLPPLNLPLARALAGRATATARLGTARGFAADDQVIAGALVRVSQMIIDMPEITALDIDPLFVGDAGARAASARITLRPPGEAASALVIPPYPAELAHEIEAGGAKFLIRPIRPEDAEAHAALFRRLTPEDVRRRFFSAIRALSPEQILRMTEVDYTREMAFVAVRLAGEDAGQTVGAARLIRSDTDGAAGEFAVVVETAAKGRGLATALMKSLIAWARDVGVREITGQVLAENAPMLAFIARLGFRAKRMQGEEDVMEVRLSLA